MVTQMRSDSTVRGEVGQVARGYGESPGGSLTAFAGQTISKIPPSRVTENMILESGKAMASSGGVRGVARLPVIQA
jgi:hypothetical protein